MLAKTADMFFAEKAAPAGQDIGMIFTGLFFNGHIQILNLLFLNSDYFIIFL